MIYQKMSKRLILLGLILVVAMQPARANQGELLSVLDSKGGFDIFIDLVEAVDLDEHIREGGPYTIVVPNDDAFDDLPEQVLQGFREDPESLRNILQFHMIQDVHSADDIADRTSVQSVLGDELYVFGDDEVVNVNEATVVELDIEYDNGVIHIIDAVLLPRQH